MKRLLKMEREEACIIKVPRWIDREKTAINLTIVNTKCEHKQIDMLAFQNNWVKTEFAYLYARFWENKMSIWQFLMRKILRYAAYLFLCLPCISVLIERHHIWDTSSVWCYEWHHAFCRSFRPVFQSHLYISLLCKRERQVAIRCAPLSSDNSCMNHLFR